MAEREFDFCVGKPKGTAEAVPFRKTEPRNLDTETDYAALFTTCPFSMTGSLICWPA